MPWYREGIVAVTAGQTTVTGTGTNFSLNARVGDAFQGPDGRWYEVANIASATVIGILPAYQGATVAAGAYGLAPMQGYVKEAADRLRQIVDQFGNKIAALGTTGNYDILPVAKGGTGGTTPATARSGLGLGSAATLNTGSAEGSAMVVGQRGIGIQGTTKASSVNVIQGGIDAYDSSVTAYSPSTYGTMLTMGFPFSDWTGQLFISCTPQSKAWIRGGSQTNAPFYEIYTTGNTTRGSGGALSAASPILRVADVARSERRDLLEQTFEAAGSYGAANDEARGVTVERADVGVYVITGSLGLALEGWRIQDPCSPDGGRMLGITQSEQDEQGVITLRLFKQRWTLDEDGEMHLRPGAPLDVPLNSWIDVRLEMPVKSDTGAPEELTV